MSTVYVFGAGATKAVFPSAPLMSELLPRALDALDRSRDGKERATRMRRFLDDFYGVRLNSHNLALGHLPRLEDVLSQIDLAIEEDRPLSKDYRLSLLRQLREDIAYAICEALQESLDQRQYAIGESGYDTMVRFLSSLAPNTTLLSTNYDLVLDNGLREIQGPSMRVDYGMPVRFERERQGRGWDNRPPMAADWQFPRPPRGAPLYKLHGSLNWVYCPVCQALDTTGEIKGMHYAYLSDTPRALLCPVCEGKYNSLIVTPTFLKTFGNGLLRQVWTRAEESIAQADQIVFIGYSLPDADIQLRCMLMRGLFRSRGRGGSTRIHVVDNQPLPNPTHDRYVQLFHSVEYFAEGFLAYVNEPRRG
jgi:hypothetical protein